ncbi:MAG: peptide-methionine (R)-S-oxide reductase, partial [Methyloceanibacter sp.]
MVRRRDILLGGAAVAALAAAGVGIKWRERATAATEALEVTKSREEWRKLLTPEQYAVLREADTVRPFTCPLNKEKRQGTFVCAGCDLPLFASETKFDSGTGWPSFYAPIENTVKQDTDFTFSMVRE